MGRYGIIRRILDQFPLESVCLVVGRHVRKSAHLGKLFRAFTSKPAGGLGRRCSIEESCKGGRVNQTTKGLLQNRCYLRIWNCKLTDGLAELSFEHGHFGASVSSIFEQHSNDCIHSLIMNHIVYCSHQNVIYGGSPRVRHTGLLLLTPQVMWRIWVAPDCVSQQCAVPSFLPFFPVHSSSLGFWR